MGTLANDYDFLEKQAIAHIHTKAPVSLTIAAPNTWQKIDLSTGSPDIEASGGWTWDAVNKYFVWDKDSELPIVPTQFFIGDAQVQITSGVSGTLVVQLGLVLNGGITPPVLITPTSYTNQSKISSYGANDVFRDNTAEGGSDDRIQQTDNVSIWIRCTDPVATPDIQIDGMNVTIHSR